MAERKRIFIWLTISAALHFLLLKEFNVNFYSSIQTPVQLEIETFKETIVSKPASPKKEKTALIKKFKRVQTEKRPSKRASNHQRKETIRKVKTASPGEEIKTPTLQNTQEKSSAFQSRNEERNAPLEPPQETPGEQRKKINEEDRTKEYISQIIKLIEKHKRYPYISRQNEEEGDVEISLTVEKDGRVSNAKIIKSSGYILLDKAAKRAIFDSSPFPPTPDGKEKTLTVKIKFKLVG